MNHENQTSAAQQSHTGNALGGFRNHIHDVSCIPGQSRTKSRWTGAGYLCRQLRRFQLTKHNSTIG